MAATDIMARKDEICNEVFGKSPDLLRELLSGLLRTLIEEEVSARIGAEDKVR